MSDKKKKRRNSWKAPPGSRYANRPFQKGKEPSPMPEWIRKIKDAREKEQEDKQPSTPQETENHSREFNEEEKAEFKKATKVPKSVATGLEKILLRMERIKSDPDKLREFQDLMVQEYAGDE